VAQHPAPPLRGARHQRARGVVLKGGLNLSVLDYWWAEAYDGLNSFAVGIGENTR